MEARGSNCNQSPCASGARAQTSSSMKVNFTVNAPATFDLSLSYLMRICNSFGLSHVDWSFKLSSVKSGVINSYSVKRIPWCNSPQDPLPSGVSPGTNFWRLGGHFVPGDTYTLEIRESKEGSGRSQDGENGEIHTNFLLNISPST
jgi:hypothetical protein